jgi:hypothetical protein
MCAHALEPSHHRACSVASCQHCHLCSAFLLTAPPGCRCQPLDNEVLEQHAPAGLLPQRRRHHLGRCLVQSSSTRNHLGLVCLHPFLHCVAALMCSPVRLTSLPPAYGQPPPPPSRSLHRMPNTAAPRHHLPLSPCVAHIARL